MNIGTKLFAVTMAHCENLRLECETLLRKCLETTHDNSELCEVLSQVEGPERSRIADLALRNVLWGILDEIQASKNDELEHKEKLTHLVDLMVSLCEREFASPNLPGKLDCLESLETHWHQSGQRRILPSIFVLREI